MTKSHGSKRSAIPLFQDHYDLVDSGFRLPLLLLAIGLFTLLIGESVFAHKWDDASGTFSVEADFIGLENGAVKLRKADGRVISVQLDKLSEESRTQAKQLARSSVITAEGSGATADEALRDAFRNAVRQVVGAVVDGETLVKNDEIIKDQVLTYSDGFINSYEEVADSKGIESGLHRITIMANVERRNVIAKLKAANVTVEDVTGKDLFAKVVTEAQAKEDATQLLKKGLADLPTLLTAEVVGKKQKFEYDADTSEIVLTVSVKPDLKAYGAFARRLSETLKKVALAKNSVVIQGTPFTNWKDAALLSVGSKGRQILAAQNKSNDAKATGIYLFQAPSKGFDLLRLPIPEETKNAWRIWICSATSSASKLQWNGYVVDADMANVLSGILVSQKPLTSEGVPQSDSSGTSERWSAKTFVSIQFIGSDQRVITRDEFELFAESPPYPYFARERASKQQERMYWNLLRQNYAQNLFVAPYSFTVDKSPFRGEQSILIWQREQTYPRRIRATLDELKQIETVRCNVIYMAGE